MNKQITHFIKLGIFSAAFGLLFSFSWALALYADDGSAIETSAEQETAAPSDVAIAPSSAPAVSGAVTAETPTDTEKMVREIEVRGNHVISLHTILTKIRTRKDQPLKRDLISDDIKKLYDTGFFKDIKIDFTESGDGYKVIITVDEKPIIREIIIEGGTKFDAGDLRKEAKLIEGQVLSEFELKDGVEAIRKKYHNKGYKFVDVTSEISVDAETKEAVVYIRINEGAVYKIRSIVFSGVKSFKEKKIRKLFRTKKAGWFRKGAFKEDQFGDDMNRLESHYQDNGFLDVKIEPKFNYDHPAQRIDIEVIIEEGSRYETGKVGMEGNILFPESDIWQQLKMLPGLTYSVRGLEEDTDAVRRYYYERGYMNADIEPKVQMNSATGKMDITYQITEGDLFFIDQIKIRGNTKTKDLVIRRALLVFPGERFDGKKLDNSKVRLEDLGYFEEVVITTEDGSAPNRRNVVVHIKEKRTGELSFGAGISSVESFLGFAEISQRNFDFKNFPTFTGAGQFIALRGRLGSIRQDVEFRFVEPYIFNKPYSFGLSAFSRTRQRNNVDFDENRKGFTVDVGKRFTETINSSIGYTLENVELEDIDPDASLDVTASGTDNLLSRVRWAISRDTRNSTRVPTSGSLSSFSSELVGSFLGGDQDLMKFQTNFTKYFLFAKRHHFEWANMAGVITPFGESDQVPVFERYYAGGLGSVRGYGSRRVGPIESGDAVGGSTILLSSIEYSFPIIENFQGAVFVDAGHVNEATFDADFGDLAVSIGPGLKVNTPIGPVALYYGFPIFNADDKDENGKFEFTLSRGF